MSTRGSTGSIDEHIRSWGPTLSQPWEMIGAAYLHQGVELVTLFLVDLVIAQLGFGNMRTLPD